jgi:predicted nucleic acid-binding protein
VAERWVVNASPLISLGRIGRLDLLSALAVEIVVPDAVAAEVRRVDDTASATLNTPAFGIEKVDLHPLVGPWGLGAGEAAVLSFAKDSGSHVAVLDDLVARRCASALRIPSRGTLGIVLLAKSRGIISSAAAVLTDLQVAGLYVSPSLVAHALDLVGEGKKS